MIIDVHVHAFPDFLAPKAMETLSRNSGEYQPHTDGTLTALLHSMDRAGVHRAFVANIATRPEQARPILDWCGRIASERILPLASVHPASGLWEEELEAVAAAGVPGIKLHPQYQGFVLDDPALRPFFEKAARTGLFVLVHAGFDVAFPGDERAAPERVRALKDGVPDLILIAAHLGGWRAWDRVVQCLAGHEVYLDTSFLQEVDIRIRERILERHDRRKLLFGSDSPWLSQEASLEAVRSLPLEEAGLQAILGDNAEGLLAQTLGRLRG